MESTELLKALTEADGISGNEKEIRNVIKKEFGDNFECTYDRLGSMIITKPSDKRLKNLKIMIAAHMDEVGFMVTAIDDKGFIKFIPIGGWWSNVLLAQKVKITTKDGKKITGIIGSEPPHLMEKGDADRVVEMKSMFIDIGVSSKEEAEKSGIQLGDMITPLTVFDVLENPSFISGKALDNRAGCAATIEVLKNYDGEDTTIELYGAFTVQEEVGLRGATTAANKINPDLAIVLDVSLATDYPGVSEAADEKLGLGPVINILDGSSICNKGLLDFVINVAKEAQIPFQIGMMPKGGTDAGKIHISAEGVPTIGISFATRYIHSHSSIIHMEDYQNAVKLINTILAKMDYEEYVKLIVY